MSSFAVKKSAKLKWRTKSCPRFPASIISQQSAALEKAGFSIVHQGKHIIMSDGTRILTIPRNNPINAFSLGGIVRDAGLTIGKFRELL